MIACMQFQSLNTHLFNFVQNESPQIKPIENEFLT